MDLAEARARIDAIDLQIRELLMRRLDCSEQVVEAKIAAGETTIFRADREEAVLKRLGEGVPPERAAGYLAVVRKIMETSRMYQYGLMFDRLGSPLGAPEGGTRVRIRLTRENRPNAMSSILSMIGDYGYNMDRMELLSYNEGNTVTFELWIVGSPGETPMRKLLFQLSKESQGFQILPSA